MGKSKLKTALLRLQGRDPIREKQKRISRRQPKILRRRGNEEEEEEEESEGSEAPDLVNVSALKGIGEKEAEEEEESGSAESGEEDEEEEVSDIAFSDVSDSDIEVPDLIPYQKLTINNTMALTSCLRRISLPQDLPFVETLSLTTADPVEIKDVHDDLARELAFYKQALDAANTGRERILGEGLPFSRPVDYFAEMLKDDEHMGKIKQKLLDEAAGKRAAQEARKQRDLKKFGKKVQVAKLQEREKAKRETLEKIRVLKRKRKGGADTDLANEADMFDIALEEAAKDRRGGGRDGINRKRQRKDQKYGFGGKKRFSKSTDARSSGDLSSFSNKRNKSEFAGVKKRKPAMRPGKSKRAGRR